MREGVSALGRRIGDSLIIRSRVNRAASWILAAAGPILVAVGLLSLRSSIGLAGFLSGALLAVALVAVIGGIWPALVSAIVAIVLGAYFYTAPFDSLNIDNQADFVAFGGFVIVAAVFGVLVDQLVRLARQQSSLRRVATLVARAAMPGELFAAVTQEVRNQLRAGFARMVRSNPDNSVTFVAASSTPGDELEVGTTFQRETDPARKSVTAMVLRTGRPARLDNMDELPAPLAENARMLQVGSVVGAPIIVERRVWGVMVVGSMGRRKLPADTESRLASFTDLVATAIANAESRAELAASRARIVAAADETRRRIERDLHDGTQQRLVSLAIELRAAEDRVPADQSEQRAAFSHAATGLAETVKDLQEISRGIHPAILSKGGLTPAIKTLARRSMVPVELDLQVEQRLPEQVEVAAYYVVSEALTNVDKYAHASLVHVDVHASPTNVELAVRDDGIGGADPSRGSGLIGLKDRVESLGGTVTIVSEPGEGSSVVARIPTDGKSVPEAERQSETVRRP
jgi:signal transduction histidine kinase